MPLPGISTLKRWVSGFSCKPGMSQFAVDMLKATSVRLAPWDRVCVFSFDEMSVDQRLCYDVKEDQVLGPYSNVQVFIVRGLMSSWKQPIYFDFNVTFDAALLKDVICQIEYVGYQVVACVCDMAGGNRGLLTSLGVCETSPSFKNPYDESRQVWCFADIPHILKLVRNNFLDYGFQLGTGTVITKQTVQLLMETEDGRTYLFTSADDNNVVDDMMMMMMMMCPRVSS